ENDCKGYTLEGFHVKSITVEQMVKRFSLEVLAGEDRLQRPVTKSRAHRPGLEFVGFFNFFPMERVQVLGRKEITYLHTLTHDERQLHIGNIVKYPPPCFIVRAAQGGLTYLMKYCAEEGIPLLRTAEHTSEFIAKLDVYLTKELAPEMAIH